MKLHCPWYLVPHPSLHFEIMKKKNVILHLKCQIIFNCIGRITSGLYLAIPMAVFNQKLQNSRIFKKYVLDFKDTAIRL